MGFIVLANPILKMIYPSASEGGTVLQIMSIAMILIALNHTVNGGLYGLNLPRVPVIALVIGIIVKVLYVKSALLQDGIWSILLLV